MKKFYLGVIVLAVLIVGVVIGVGLFLGSIVKKGMETVGPKITQVSIKVDAVNLSLLNGSAKVTGLVVGNPEGYKTPQAISVGSAAVGVNPLTVFSDKIVVRSVRVEAPEITFEGGLGGNNLSKIMENVNAIAKSGGPASTNTTARAGNKPGRKIEVDDFLITGATVHVSLTGIGGKGNDPAAAGHSSHQPGQGQRRHHGDGFDAARARRHHHRHHQGRRQRHH